MKFVWKVFVFCGIFIQNWITIQAATTTIDLFNARSIKNDNILPTISSINNANKSYKQIKSYTTTTTRSLDEFNPRPQIKPTKYSSSHPSNIFTSYAPPPSGIVSYKNIQLPFRNSVKLPTLIPNSIPPYDFTKHPGFVAPPASSDEIEVEKPEAMYMIEEPASVLLQLKHNKTIEAAKTLASTILQASGESPLELTETNFNGKENSTDVYIVKSQKIAYIIPTYLNNEATKASAVDELYPLRDQFEKAYTINQFIFVIKPERINFLNKLV